MECVRIGTSYEERYDFEHWLSAVERISVWNWWVRNPIQQKLSQFSSKSYREMAKHSPERIWNLFKKCSNTTFFSKLIAQLFKTSAEVDTLEKIQIFLKFGLSKKVRVHWALQFSNIEDVEETFEYLNLLNNDALRSEIFGIIFICCCHCNSIRNDSWNTSLEHTIA